MHIHRQLLFLPLLLSLPFSISAKEITAKDQLICAISKAALCRENTGCTEGSVEIVNLPLLLRLNLEKKTIASTRLSGEQHASTIMTVSTSKNNLILQGIEDGSGWSMTVDKKNGQMSVSSSLDGEGYIAFGVCARS